MFNIDNDCYVITWEYKGKRYFADMGECGYPYTIDKFSPSVIQYSLKAAQDSLDVWFHFNMWKPEIDFTPSNVKIMKLNFELTDI